MWDATIQMNLNDALNFVASMQWQNQKEKWIIIVVNQEIRYLRKYKWNPFGIYVVHRILTNYYCCQCLMVVQSSWVKCTENYSIDSVDACTLHIIMKLTVLMVWLFPIKCRCINFKPYLTKRTWMPAAYVSLHASVHCYSVIVCTLYGILNIRSSDSSNQNSNTETCRQTDWW